MEGKCKVIVRVRPLLENEPKDADAVSVDTEKNNIQVSPGSRSQSSPQGKTLLWPRDDDLTPWALD